VFPSTVLKATTVLELKRRRALIEKFEVLAFDLAPLM